MVNVEMLLEKMDGLAVEDKNGVKVCDSQKILWWKDELEEINTIPQLMGRIHGGLPIDDYDEIYSRLDDSIFEPNVAKVKENLEKLGLKGTFDRCYYLLSNGDRISKRCFYYIEDMEPIPKAEIVWSSERLYNDILKASKEWNDEI